MAKRILLCHFFLRPILRNAFCQKGQTLDGIRQSDFIEIEGKALISDVFYRPHHVFGDM